MGFTNCLVAFIAYFLMIHLQYFYNVSSSIFYILFMDWCNNLQNTCLNKSQDNKQITKYCINWLKNLQRGKFCCTNIIKLHVFPGLRVNYDDLSWHCNWAIAVGLNLKLGQMLHQREILYSCFVMSGRKLTFNQSG